MIAYNPQNNTLQDPTGANSHSHSGLWLRQLVKGRAILGLAMAN